MRVVFLVLKFGLLAILYLFILRVFHFILTDLRRVSAKGANRTPGKQVPSGAELVVTESNDPAVRPGEVIKLSAATRVGRGKHNHLSLTDSFVSHDHMQIIFKQGKFFLEDLNSINGTYINGVRVKEPVSLSHGDAIRIAGVSFKFVRWEYEVE